MGLGSLFQRLRGGGRDVRELARRLSLLPSDLREIRPAYASFEIPKRGGGTRRILAPEKSFKELQRRLLRRLLARLPAHDAAHGFERGRSIATHARHHVGKAIVVRLDIRDFFPSTSADRVKAFFRRIGWDRKSAGLLTSWCTWEGGLPQGAPTSPRLANLLNRRLDARLAGLAASLGGVYTRYADDLTFSFEDAALDVNRLVHVARACVEDEGYRLHVRRKLRVMRPHHRQVVTGLVVNERTALPRATRRRLRAVEHHLRTGRSATLSAEQLDGWRALERMIADQGA